MAKALILVAFLALSACQAASGSFCELNKPQRLSEATIDAMTDQEVKDALAHNRLGARLCGWKP